MSYETLKELLDRRPFEPFEIRLSNGERYEVRHPEMALLLKSRIIVGDADNDRMTIVALIHINSIETLQST
jgi:predicted lipid-binding transport protein (Tim44 family)